jgi:hypothetical protein
MPTAAPYEPKPGGPAALMGKGGETQGDPGGWGYFRMNSKTGKLGGRQSIPGGTIG